MSIHIKLKLNIKFKNYIICKTIMLILIIVVAILLISNKKGIREEIMTTMDAMPFKEGHILPTIRIQKIVLENFKSVTYGEVLFNCGRKVIPQDTEADILGIYGQNGSGKSSVIDAISILKLAMSGWRIDEKHSESIAEGADYSRLSFTFDFQYPPDNKTRTVVYSFKLRKIRNEDYTDPNSDDAKGFDYRNFYEYIPQVFDEEICAGGFFDNANQKMQTILSASGGKYPIGPVRKISQYVGDYKDKLLLELELNKRTASKNKRSFIFSDDTMDLFCENSGNSDYVQVLMELKWYALHYLFVVDSNTANLGSAQLFTVFYTRVGPIPLFMLGHRSRLRHDDFELFKEAVDRVNAVLPTMIAGLQLVLSQEEVIKGDEIWHEYQLYSKRNDCVIPLRDESAGLIRIISILSYIIYAFNDRSATVAIDELDAGVYEYLLGELLIGLQTYGKGQFVFTSHNLRPLEVLKKENILFTTTNPNNRFIRLKGVGHTNNLRSLYLREILGDSQDEQIYDAAKRQRMVAAFLRAGDGHGEEK